MLLVRAKLKKPEHSYPFLDHFPITPHRPMIQWEQLTDWITPEENFFSVSHYGAAKVEVAQWHLEISGLVKKPKKNFAR